jgi:hypothetical protein
MRTMMVWISMCIPDSMIEPENHITISHGLRQKAL